MTRKARGFDVPFVSPLVRAVCLVRAKKVHPAKWYGSKGGPSRGGAALNALGSLTILAPSPANH